MALHRIQSIVMMLVVGMTLAMGGCQSAPSPRQAPRYENEGYHRPRNPYFNPKPILALDSVELNKLSRDAGMADAQRPVTWFDSRNDVRSSTVAGQYGPTLEIISTYTSDRQYQHGDQVLDHYHHNTYRNSVRQTVR